ncbi:DUF3037 domain-containing protein [Gluconobacter japonicus]|uniref:DUF3037 domain-containing protein n=1 Tax=Gluconobacter japonicus TaxID=376620 RepID=UPI001B8BCCDC|nr:DUF3037 domain-containing protein [Gluconobacter japonicus]MBS1050515.1 DUF3037 domain-containing protein [Gluconobacter japonicus]
MEALYKFSLIRLSPDYMRGETLNIGVLVWHDKGVNVHYPRNLDKVKSLSQAISPESVLNILKGISNSFENMSEYGLNIDSWKRVFFANGPISLSREGEFLAETENLYYDRVQSILLDYVIPEPLPKILREKKTKLLTHMKHCFRAARVLAKKSEDLSSHRLVSSVMIDDGLNADLMLKNGKYHVIETVDAKNATDVTRKIISDIGISSLVLERARMNFGENKTSSILVYSASSLVERHISPSLLAVEHRDTQLVNWESDADRSKFIKQISSIAQPYESKRRSTTVFVQSENEGFKFN